MDSGFSFYYIIKTIQLYDGGNGGDRKLFLLKGTVITTLERLCALKCAVSIDMGWRARVSSRRINVRAGRVVNHGFGTI